MFQKILALSATLIVIALATLSNAQETGEAAVAMPPVPAQESKQARPKFPTIYVTDMHCKHCGQRLARKLFTVPGVKKVRANIAKDFAIVEPQRDKTLSPLRLWEAAEAAKFQVVKIETPQATYEKKPVELDSKSRNARSIHGSATSNR